MKKNRMMRLASGLMVAVLLTTSLISGTFAKYTTSDSAKDSARVAKWGVEVAATGHLFDTSYDKAAKNTAHTGNNTITVAASDSTSVVAPGTKNDEGITFSIEGTPEVATKIDIVLETKDVFLAAGTYADMTTGTSTATVNGTETVSGDADTFTIDAVYNPVVFTLKDDGTEVAKGTLKDIENYLEGLTEGFIAPNTDLTNKYGTYTLTWNWEFEQTNDEADTLLGNMAADTTLKAKYVENKFYPMAENQEYCNTASFNISITVTQID